MENDCCGGQKKNKKEWKVGRELPRDYFLSFFFSLQSTPRSSESKTINENEFDRSTKVERQSVDLMQFLTHANTYTRPFPLFNYSQSSLTQFFICIFFLLLLYQTAEADQRNEWTSVLLNQIQRQLRPFVFIFPIFVFLPLFPSNWLGTQLQAYIMSFFEGCCDNNDLCALCSFSERPYKGTPNVPIVLESVRCPNTDSHSLLSKWTQ